MRWIIVGTLAIISQLPTPALAEYKLEHVVISSAAIEASGGPYALKATLGESPFLVTANQPWELSLGFWLPDPAGTTEVNGVPPVLHDFQLEQNSPNPFNPFTRIRFIVPGMTGTQERAILGVYSIQGRLLRTLVNDALPAGPHMVTWDGLDANGCPAASGVYLVRLEAGQSATTKQCVLLR